MRANFLLFGTLWRLEGQLGLLVQSLHVDILYGVYVREPLEDDIELEEETETCRS